MKDRQATIKALRELADYLEERPGVPTPYIGAIFAFADPDVHPIAGVARTMGGFAKSHDGTWLNLVKDFGAFTLEVLYKSELVCERVVVGTENVPEKTVPAHTKEIVEWQCPESLLAYVAPTGGAAA
jgi:hypothetical protein